jgi:hypothetical protein
VRRPQDRIRLVAIVTTAAIAASSTGSDMPEDRQAAPIGTEYDVPISAAVRPFATARSFPTLVTSWSELSAPDPEISQLTGKTLSPCVAGGQPRLYLRSPTRLSTA